MKLISLFSLLAVLTTQIHAADPLTRPNIIVFLADDMGIGDTSAYQDWTGNKDHQQVHTPAMEKLANQGIRFLDAHSPASLCTPSRYSLLTGRYAWRTRLKHGVLLGVHHPPLVDQDRITLPEYLQKHGYHTGMVGKWHLGLVYRNMSGEPASGWEDADLTKPILNGPLDHGFDSFLGFSRSHGTSGPNGNEPRNHPKQSIGPGWINGRAITGATGDGKRLTGSYQWHGIGSILEARAFWVMDKATREEKPFFLYFSSPANHGPYTPDPQLGETPIAGASQFKDGSPTRSDRLDYVYQNDVHIQRLLDRLKNTPDPRRPGFPLSENTLFVFASDNGSEIVDPVSTGHLRSNKASAYEGGHRIPLIISWSAGNVGDSDPATPGSESKRLIGLNDLYATVAEILKTPLPPADRAAEDSISQLAALTSGDWEPRYPLFPHDHKEAGHGRERACIAVRSNNAPLPGEWKLILDHTFAYGQAPNPIELYELSKDRAETRNLINEEAYSSVVDFLLKAARESGGDDGRTPARQN